VHVITAQINLIYGLQIHSFIFTLAANLVMIKRCNEMRHSTLMDDVIERIRLDLMSKQLLRGIFYVFTILQFISVFTLEKIKIIIQDVVLLDANYYFAFCQTLEFPQHNVFLCFAN
jgi:hypothetical protein